MPRPTSARIGVVGAGWWATTVHLPALAANPDATLVAVADTDPARAELAARRFGTRALTDHRQLLELEPDGVVVATPHDTHYPIARDALLAGADVLVEKPMVILPEHGHELVRLAAARGRRLHVGYPHPYTSHAQELRRLVHAGALGELVLTTSVFATAAARFYRRPAATGAVAGGGIGDGHGRRRAADLPAAGTYDDPARGGGQALTQVTHAAALLLFVTGLVPVEVMALTATLGARVDVIDAATFRARGGALGTIASTGTLPAGEPTVEQLRLFGTRGDACIDTADGTLQVRAAGAPARSYPQLPPEARYPRAAPAARLVDAILGRAPVLVDGELGTRAAELVAMLLRAAGHELAGAAGDDRPLPAPSRPDRRDRP